MIVLLGDTHGIWPTKWPEATLAIQLGDFGFWPGSKYKERWLKSRPSYPVWFIEGNHDHIPALYQAREGRGGLVEVWPGAWHVPRGHVATLNGFKVGFCGGADSLDNCYRTAGHDWFPEERVEPVEFTVKPDILVVHEIPTIIANYAFPGQTQNPFCHGPVPTYSRKSVDAMVMQYEPQHVFSGHIHRSMSAYNSGTHYRVLDINEFATLPERN